MGINFSWELIKLGFESFFMSGPLNFLTFARPIIGLTATLIIVSTVFKILSRGNINISGDMEMTANDGDEFAGKTWLDYMN